MPVSFDVMGVYMPGAVLLLLMLIPVYAALDQVLVRTGVYSRLWHPSLFRMSAIIAIYSISYVYLMGH